MSIPECVKTVIGKLLEAGYEAYLVGGCVRDNLMKKTPTDYDVTTSALPDEIKNVFTEFKTFDVGIKHGTVTVISGGFSVEVTTYRVDGDYTDNRHPDAVSFTRNFYEDLARRDFTMNAVAFNEVDGLVDRFDGIGDINKRIIRCVGNPQKRFCEDALRILRALRFASTLDFNIDFETEKAIFEKKHLLLNVSSERVSEELKKLLCGKAVRRILTDYCEVLSVVIPEIADCIGFNQNTKYHIYDVFEHTAMVVENLPERSDLRMAGLLHDIAKPLCYSEDKNGVGHFKGHCEKGAEIADGILKNLKSDNKLREKTVTLIKYHDMKINPCAVDVKRALKVLGEETYFDLVILSQADNSAKNPEYNKPESHYVKLREIAEKLISDNACFNLKTLAVNGEDIKEIGIKDGRKIGEALNFLLDAVIEDKVLNNKEFLLNYLRGNYENRNKKT